MGTSRREDAVERAAERYEKKAEKARRLLEKIKDRECLKKAKFKIGQEVFIARDCRVYKCSVKEVFPSAVEPSTVLYAVAGLHFYGDYYDVFKENEIHKLREDAVNEVIEAKYKKIGELKSQIRKTEELVYAEFETIAKLKETL